MTPRLSSDFYRRGSAGLVAVLAGVLLSSAANVSVSLAAATAAPAWQITTITNPTQFSSADSPGGECNACDEYKLGLANVGAAASEEGSITLTDTLPPGLTVARTPTGKGPPGEPFFGARWNCAATEVGTSIATCTFFGVVGRLGEAPALSIPVVVSPGVAPDSTLTNSASVAGGGASEITSTASTTVNPSSPFSFDSGSFRVADLTSYLADPAGAPDVQAAGHPGLLRTSFDVTSVLNLANNLVNNPTKPSQDVRDIIVDLPPGFVGNPRAAPQCPLSSLVLTSSGENNIGGESACPPASQVGTVTLNGNGSYTGGHQMRPVYNMVPEHGFPAEFGFQFAGHPIIMYPSVVGSGANTHVRVSVPGVPAVAVVGLQGALVTFFGDPAAQDGAANPSVAFLTNPGRCTGDPLVTTIHLDSYENPGRANADGTPDFTDPAWKSATTTTPALEGCGALNFSPTMSLTPDSLGAGAPTGLGVDIGVPQSNDPQIPATPNVRKVRVTLPPGLVISPSAANGLGACSPSQIGLGNNDAPTCPDASKIGTVRVKTPLLEQELEGSVYLAQQGNAGPSQGSNPFGSLLAIYVVAEGSGVVVKLPGKVEADEHTGQLTTTFDEDPQLPFSVFKLHFKNGPRAPLSNPPLCGKYTPQAQLSSWSGQTVESDQSFELTQGENGGPCPVLSFAPSFIAGTSNNQAAAFTSFSVTFARTDEEETLGGLTLHAPPGLLGKIAGVQQCPEPQASAGTCAPASLIGHTTVAAGPGPTPFYVTGNVFLTGPYRRAPFGLSIVVPVIAGPFNLGTEVVRSAISVDPQTAQITVTSDPLPTIRQGIPFQLRTINVTIDRPGFMFNPTNCESLAIEGTIVSTRGTAVAAGSRFQAANCASLPFKPTFLPTTRAGGNFHGATLDVKISQRPGEAAIHRVDTQLPLALPSRLVTLQKACTETQFAANPAGCPSGSDVGIATARTPLLNVPLTGPAYLVSHGGAAFPDLDIVLQGEGVTIDLVGNTDIKKGITYSRFEAVPDAPISSFDLNLPGGPGAVLAAIKNLCAPTNTVTVTRHVARRVGGRVKHLTVKLTRSVPEPLTMPTTITGQNGAVVQDVAQIAVAGCRTAKPSAKISSARVKGHFLALTFVMSQKGTVTVSGGGLRTVRETLTAGRHQIKAMLTGAGKARRRTKVSVTVRNSNGSSSTAMTFKL